MKKKIIKIPNSLILILGGFFLAILLLPFHKSFAQENPPDNVPYFLDVPQDNPYYVSISYLKDKGVVTGYEDKTFMPEAVISKVEALRVILDAAQIVSDEVYTPIYPDVPEGQWFTPYVIKAHHLGVVKGSELSGNFEPANQVNLAEFLKMLILANNIDTSSVHGATLIPNIVPEDWFADYLNYAAQIGILAVNGDGTLDPGKLLTRGEVADMIYLLAVMQQGNDPNFLLNQAKVQLNQVDVYLIANKLTSAKSASQLAVQFTQQAYKTNPIDPLILGDAKVARAYDWLMDAIILGVQKKNEEAVQKANEAIDKATEAWEANHDTQPVAAHIKEKARELLAQLGGVES